MLDSLSAKDRQAVIEVAKKYGWNTTTTKEKIVENCKMNNDPAVRNLVLSLYRA